MHAPNLTQIKIVQIVCMQSNSDSMSRDLIKESSCNRCVWTILYLQITVCLKQDWNTLKGMHEVCMLFANWMQQVCTYRLDAHFCILQHWVCKMSAQIVCIKCAFAHSCERAQPHLVSFSQFRDLCFTSSLLITFPSFTLQLEDHLWF